MTKEESKIKKNRIGKICLIVALTGFILIMFVVSIIISLPSIVSTKWFKNILTEQIQKNINRPVHVENIQWTWADGITIDGFQIEDDPDFSEKPFFEIKNLKINPYLRTLFYRTFKFDILINDINCNILRDAQGRLNMSQLLVQQQNDTPQEPKNKINPQDQTYQFKMPLDISGNIQITDFALSLTDMEHNKTVAIRDGDFRLQMPSLSNQPIILMISSDIEVDQQKVPSVKSDVVIQDLFDSDRQLSLHKALININTSLPGIELTGKGDLSKGINALLSIDLMQVLTVIEPLLPNDIAHSNIKGFVELKTSAKGEHIGSIGFDTMFKLVDFGLTQDKQSIGPLELSVTNTGILDALKGRVLIQIGECKLLDKTRIGWHGTIDGLYNPSIDVNMRIKESRIDIMELVEKFSMFIPKTLSFAPHDNKVPDFVIKDIGVYLTLPKGESFIEANDLELSIPSFELNLPDNHIGIKAITYRIHNLKTNILDFLPKQMELTTSCNIDEIRIRDITMRDITFSQLKISNAEFSKSLTAPLGLTGKGVIDEILEIKSIEIPSKVSVQNLKQTINVELSLQTDSFVNLDIRNFELGIPFVKIEIPNKAPLITNATLITKADKIRIRNLTPLQWDIEGFKSDFSVSDILKTELALDANSEPSYLNMQGHSRIELAALTKQIIHQLIPDIKLEGQTESSLNVIGKLPIAKQDSLKSLTVEDYLKFFDEIELNSTVTNFHSEMKTPFSYESIETNNPIKYVYSGKTNEGQISGNVTIKNITKLPIGALKEPLNIDIALSGQHELAESLILNQEMTIYPLNIKQTLQTSLYGFSKIINKGIFPPSPRWLAYLSGTIRGTVSVNGASYLKTPQKDIALNGGLTLGTELRIVPEKTVGIKIWSDIPEIDIVLGNFGSLFKVQSNIDLEKQYQIKNLFLKGQDSDRSKSWLSSEVMRPESNITMVSEMGDEVLQTYMDRMKKRFNKKPSISFRSAIIERQPNVISIDNSRFDFVLKEGLPNMDFFQMDLFGGTVIGSLNILQRGSNFYLQSRVAFSGINTEAMLNKTKTDERSELSGQVAFMIPLSSEMKSIFQELQVEINISNIGQKALERLLYAIDPYESNETIVAQRRLLRKGTPKWIVIKIENGNLSLKGEVSIMGISTKIPELKRMNISHLSGLTKFETSLENISPLIGIFRILAAKEILLNKDDKIEFGF